MGASLCLSKLQILHLGAVSFVLCPLPFMQIEISVKIIQSIKYIQICKVLLSSLSLHTAVNINGLDYFVPKATF